VLTAVTASGSRYDLDRSPDSMPTHGWFGRFRKRGDEWLDGGNYGYVGIGERLRLAYNIDPKTGDGEMITTSRVVSFEGDCQGYIDPESGEWDHPYPMTAEECPGC